jgi:hypothetical protein
MGTHAKHADTRVHTQIYIRIEYYFSSVAEDIKKFLAWSRDSSVVIATVYGLDDRGVGVRVLVGSRISLFYVVQTGSGVHTTSYKTGIGGSFPGVKRQGREADHSPPTSAEVKKM